MFITIKKHSLVIFLCVSILATGIIVYFTALRPTFMPKAEHVIVIDAGHGGIDGGAVGKQTGVDESSLNLEYAMTLKKLCSDFGFEVVLTRSDMNGLYDISAGNKKRSEMEKRRQIIANSNADLVVSIHMNSFPLSEARGAQVYYAQGSQQGLSLAQSVQDSLNANIEYAKKVSKAGDFFVLNCTDKPSILVECGFLSNPEEERLLTSEGYRKDFCYNILSGIINYYTFNEEK